MWIVRVALNRPYTFVVVALLILIASPVVVLRTPTDIFPNIDIPVIAVAWTFTGLNPEEMEGRVTTQYERILTTTVDNIEHIESTTVNGQAMVKIFLQPNARLDTANAQVTAVSQTILRFLPPGTAKIGEFEYDVAMNASPRTVAELNDLPIKVVGNSTMYLRDVANVRDGFAPQTNVVRQDGRRGTLVTVLKTGAASTVDVVQGIRNLLPRVLPTLPPALKIQLLADQSIFVKAAVSGVIREAVIAACLTALMILVFLGSWRSTVIIAVSIPLSILASIIVLSAFGETINIMTLGGLALAVGILVDDATVAIENINWHLKQGKDLEPAILDGAAQIAIPAFVSTICICIVFVPMFFLTGVARYLFVPMAEAVVFAMLASYVLSRTLVPTMAKYLLKAHLRHEDGARVSFFARIQRSIDGGFGRLRAAYGATLEQCLSHRGLFATGFLAACLLSFLLLPYVGQDFFPAVDTGQFKLHFRAPTGTRIEETARLADAVEDAIREVIPARQIASMLDNIGLPYSGLNLSYTNSGPIGAQDADILVALSEDHPPTAGYVHDLRRLLEPRFPGVQFSFIAPDIVSQILSFGLPAPIDVQVVGRNFDANRQLAATLANRLRQVPGVVDLRVHQVANQPSLQVNVDRTRAAQAGYTQRDVANNLLISLGGSGQTSPTFWLNPTTGVSYALATMTPQYRMDSLQDLRNIPITGGGSETRPQLLEGLATLTRGAGMAVVSHYDVQPVIDIFGSVQGRDLGGVANDIRPILDAARKELPRGSQLVVRGQIETMRTSFFGLLAGLVLAIVLVYLLIVVNFQSWLDPFIIISALPAALAGIVWLLFATHTTISVPALTGAIMCMGVATANSILVVSFAKELLLHHGDPVRAAIEAGFTRFRPVLMTALAMIIGMIPMTLGLGEGGEQNAPLGRAVIGGLLCATVATLIFVPAVFSLLHRRRDPSKGDPEPISA